MVVQDDRRQLTGIMVAIASVNGMDTICSPITATDDRLIAMGLALWIDVCRGVNDRPRPIHQLLHIHRLDVFAIGIRPFDGGLVGLTVFQHTT